MPLAVSRTDVEENTLKIVAKMKLPTLRIRGIVYFAWRDAPPYAGGTDFWGLHTGLLAQDGSGKPALSAYYQAAGVLGTLPHTKSGR